MTSIQTNTAAIAALQTLRSLDANLADTQSRVSSGLKVGSAADNSSYWSISTTMRSDRMAISAVSDALGLGAAKVDVAYSGMNAVIDVLGDFKAKLVAAREPGVDKAKIQAELEQFKQQVVSVAESSSFNGQNWLDTDINQIYDMDENKVSVLSSFTRGSSGVAVGTMDVHLDKISLFNTTGGGLLQADPRDVKTLGGMRRQLSSDIGSGSPTVYYTQTGTEWMHPRASGALYGIVSFDFPDGSPLDFNAPGAEIRFDITLDKEFDPSALTGLDAELNDLPGPYYAGHTATIAITKADVDAYDASLGGIVTTNTQFAGLLNTKLIAEGAVASANYIRSEPPGSNTYVHDEITTSIRTNQIHGDGSYVEIANVSSTGVSAGGLVADADFGERGSGMALTFEPFTLHIDGDNPDGVEVDFNFSINGAAPKSYNFNRTYVNNLLGKTTGAVETAAEMVTLLRSLLDADWPDTIIDVSAADPSKILLKSDQAVDRTWGMGTQIGFSDIVVSIEPLPVIDFRNIDIAQRPELIDHYIGYVDLATQRAIEGATILGTLSRRIDLQSDLADSMKSVIDKGVGRLVDADMNVESSRLKAMQTQGQLANQALQIANTNPGNIMRLFG